MTDSSPARSLPAALRRRVLLAVTLLLVLCVGWVGVVSIKVLFPPQPSPGAVDAVVALAPSYQRVPLALKLFENGHADRLAVSWFPVELDQEALRPGIIVSPAAQLCHRDRDPRIICFTPTLETTLGEAQAVRELAEENGWESVTVVTSSYHAFRAQYIFERCLSGDVDVQVQPAPVSLSFTEWVERTAYENAAFIKAILETTSSC